MIGDSHSLTPGYVQRHVPPGSGLGLDIAVLDIAQDFLLAHLEQTGVLGGLVVFKGGTALRKLFAGSQGRFSTDLDLATAESGGNRAAVADLIADQARTTLGPFRYEPARTRGRWHIRVYSPFADPLITIKLDVGPPCWRRPEVRPFVEHPTHRRYGFDLPALPCVRLEEMLAEKVARLNRRATARDAWDLVWAATTSPHSRFSASSVRTLAVLKIWVDNHGLGPDWAPAVAPTSFKPARWLSPKGEWDDEHIGLLATPPPDIGALEADLHHLYGWLADLTDREARLARAEAGDRGEVIHAVKCLADANLVDAQLWQ